MLYRDVISDDVHERITPTLIVTTLATHDVSEFVSQYQCCRAGATDADDIAFGTSDTCPLGGSDAINHRRVPAFGLTHTIQPSECVLGSDHLRWQVTLHHILNRIHRGLMFGHFGRALCNALPHYLHVCMDAHRPSAPATPLPMPPVLNERPAERPAL